ncbi:MAG: hypothetical protein JNM81_14225 [Rhodospirillaceae bacterium]|nr:hypothetical protein [Rhodospirillaceae bacterium]
MAHVHTRALSGVINVDGDDYEWSLRREARHSKTGHGMAIAIKLVGAKREAVLDFPMPKPIDGAAREWSWKWLRPKITDDILTNGIRGAIAAGWRPTSRGKTETFSVDKDGN